MNQLLGNLHEIVYREKFLKQLDAVKNQILEDVMEKRFTAKEAVANGIEQNIKWLESYDDREIPEIVAHKESIILKLKKI